MRPGRCAVIGGGLAGAAVAASFARRGWRVGVYDKAAQPAAGASALPAGLMAPHVSADDNLLSQLTRAGVDCTLQQAQALLREGDWALSGVETRRGGAAIHHATGAWVRPAALVHAWLATPGVRWHGNQAIERAEDLDADLVVVAAALGSAALAGLELTPVRGQVTWAWREGTESLPPTPLNGNGHFIPCAPVEGRDAWLTGSTYARGDTGLDVRAEDDAANLERLRALAPEVAAQLAPRFENGEVRAWTGVRCTSTDRRPLVGFVGKRIAVCTAMGSRGLTFAAPCAELLAAQVHGEPLPLPGRLAAALDVARVR